MAERVRSTPASLVFVVAAAVGLAFLGATQLDRYHVTWDEALGDLFWGQRYFSFYTSLDPVYLDPAVDPYPEGHRPDLRASPFRDRPWEYYPAANALAAATSRVLSSGLGWLDPFDGFHAVNLWLGAILFVALWWVTRTELGAVAAWLACGLLFLSPRLVVHAMANVKDYPEMVFFALALLLFHRAWQRGSVAGLLGAGLVWGLALATKANALFLPPIVVATVLLGRRPDGRASARCWGALLGAGALGGATMLLLWAWLWPDPIARFTRHLSYVSGQVFQVREESLLSPLLAIVGTTPPLFLALVVVGLGRLLPRAVRREPFAVLILAWIGVVLGRLYLPGAVNFDGVRHFLELFPALALAAGAGGAGVLEAWERRWPGRVARALAGTVLLLVAVGSVAVATMRSHPYQLAYWNVLVGGTAGAWERQLPQAGDYWGTTYRLGLDWINRHAEPAAVLTVPIAQHGVTLVAPERLRSDIGIAAVTVPNFPDLRPGALEWLRDVAAERPVYVMFVLRRDWSNALVEDCLERLQPAAEWRLDGVALLRIYRYHPPGAER